MTTNTSPLSLPSQRHPPISFFSPPSPVCPPPPVLGIGRKEGREKCVCVYRRNDLISCGCLASQGARREGGWSVALVTLWHPAWQEAGSQSGDDPSSPFPAANIGPPPPLLSPGAMLASLPLSPFCFALPLARLGCFCPLRSVIHIRASGGSFDSAPEATKKRRRYYPIYCCYA